MSSRMKIFLLCPIPEEQKPINEYIGLKKSGSLMWIKRILNNNFRNLFICFTFLIFFFFFRSFCKDFFVFFSFYLFFILTVFFTWNQLKKRFNKPRLFYEEASWYDGQFWEKPFSILKNDRFLSTQQIQPFLEKFFQHLLLSFFGNIVFLLVLS